jgi:hypothetical protein
MAIDKLIPQYLNKDEDARLVKSYEMIDALNVRVSNDDAGNQGIVKNVQGTTAIQPRRPSETIPASGTNRVIGAVSSEAGKVIYFFLYNSAGNHGIYAYSSITDTYQKVYSDSVLKFNQTSYVDADVVINQFGEHLLYFTDNVNEPRKINATKALSAGYSVVISTGTDVEKELFLTVCKQPPQTPITFEFITEDADGDNQLKDEVFQFAYQYVYDDGEVSAISSYSKLTVSETHLAYDSGTQALTDGENNALRLTFNGSDGPVTKIRLLARRGNSGSFFRITEVDNTGSGTQEFIFRNDSIYNLVPEQDALKLFDSVPRKAFTQAISNNRLFYGNYTEGFDNIDTDVYNYAVYHPRPMFFDIGVERGDVEGPQNVEQAAYYRHLFGIRYPAEGSITPQGVVSYADASTQGISFDLDLSEINANISSVPSSDVAFNVQLSAHEFGLGTFGDLDMHFRFPVTVLGTDGEVVHSQEYRFCTPQYANTNTTPPGNYDNTFIGYNTGVFGANDANSIGSLCRLQLTSNLEFFDTFTVDSVGASGTGDMSQAVGEQIAQNVVGLTATAAVRPRDITNFSGYDSNPLWDGLTFSGVTGQYNHTCRAFAADGSSNQLTLWFDGSITYQIYSAEYLNNGGSPKLKCKIRLVDIDLNAIKVAHHSASTVSDAGGSLPSDYFGDGYSSSNQTYDPDGVICNINSNTENQNGHLLKDQLTSASGSGNKIISALTEYELVRGSVRYVESGDKTATSFKAGANHDFGVVYFDHRNRPSGVQKIDTVNVAHFFSEKRSGNLGRSEVDLRILHEPPYWAKKWAPVYSKNTTYEKILQTTIAEAGLPRKSKFEDILATDQSTDGANERKIIEALPGGETGVIFISLRTLEGKTNSYKESKGANLSYEFLEGDVLRILEHATTEGGVARPGIELPITSYRYYTDNEENPIELFGDSTGSDSNELNAYRRSGWFLTVRDQGINNFDRLSVAAQTDYFSENCLVEIYRPKKKLEDNVYYEIGDVHDVITVGGQLTHAGDRSNSSSPSFDITITGATSFVTSQRLYLGDKIITLGTNSGYAFVNSIRVLPDGRYRYGIHYSNPFVDDFINTVDSGVTISTTVGDATSIFPGVITLEQGDVYFRLRELLVNPKDASGVIDKTDAAKQEYQSFIIEDESVSDFFESNSTSIGRPHIETPDQAEITRVSSVTYSDPFVLDSTVLMLSSFNPTQFPFQDYSPQHGDICTLMDRNEALLVMQENKVSNTPISRVLIESAADGQLVTSQQVMGTPTYYAGSYGPGLNPEGVVERFGKVFFSDVSSGDVVQLDGNGLAPISAKKMDSFFETNFENIISNGQGYKVPSGYDPENDEYIITMPVVSTKAISSTDSDIGAIGDVFASTDLTTLSPDGVVDPIFRDGVNPYETIPDFWNLDVEVWNESGNGILFLDKLLEKGGVVLSKDLARSGRSGVNVAISTTDNLLRGVATITTADMSIDIPTSATKIADGSSISLAVAAASAAQAAQTIAWSPTKTFWLTFYSFTPELYANLHNRFFSFVNGQMHRHNVNATYNNFYGSQYNSELTVVSKLNPSMIKVFDSLSLEGDAPWAAVVSNSNQETSEITTAFYDEREGMYYTVIPKDSTASSTTNTSHRVVLGQVASVDGTKITFTSKVSGLPFGLGDTLFKLESSSETNLSLTISSVSGRKEITANTTVTGVAVGDTIMAVSNDDINGDKIRDYYAQIKLTNTATNAVELYAVNTSFTMSPMHNEMGGQSRED